MADKDIWSRRRKRVSEVIEVGYDEDRISRLYDLLNSTSIVVNLVISILYTFEPFRAACGGWLLSIETVTVAFFAVDYRSEEHTSELQSQR